MRARFAIPFVVVSGLALVRSAHAQTDGDRLAELGMLGRWAPDCRELPAPKNVHVVFERLDDGAARYLMMFEVGLPMINTIEHVRRLDGGRFAMRATIALPSKRQAFDIVVAKEPTRWRVIESVGVDGTVYIKDGANVATRAPNRWNNWCSGTSG